jgi:twitching motility protein PilT
LNTALNPLDPYLAYLLAADATDLHLSVGSAPWVRIDGQLLAMPDAPVVTTEFLTGIIDGLLSEVDRASFAEHRQVDLSFAWSAEGRSARLRANAYYQRDQPALALRVIPDEIPTPEQIGLPESTSRLVTRPHGLVLMTGPTGSGKSTTLAAMIGWINHNRPVHVLTIEDPIEYVHRSDRALVNQREVGSDCTSFAEALRAALREDPDVVLVGEMRDL